MEGNLLVYNVSLLDEEDITSIVTSTDSNYDTIVDRYKDLNDCYSDVDHGEYNIHRIGSYTFHEYRDVMHDVYTIYNESSKSIESRGYKIRCSNVDITREPVRLRFRDSPVGRANTWYINIDGGHTVEISIVQNMNNNSIRVLLKIYSTNMDAYNEDTLELIDSIVTMLEDF